MGAQTKSLPEAWAVVEQLLAQPRVYFAEEPKGLDALLPGHCALGGSSSRFWTEAYLAAFTEAGGLALATFDRGFRKFVNLDLELLSTRGRGGARTR
jgi:predicted nucleic acid-binding protein